MSWSFEIISEMTPLNAANYMQFHDCSHGICQQVASKNQQKVSRIGCSIGVYENTAGQ